MTISNTFRTRLTRSVMTWIRLGGKWVFAIFQLNNNQNWWKFDKVLTKTNLHIFETRCTTLNYWSVASLTLYCTVCDIMLQIERCMHKLSKSQKADYKTLSKFQSFKNKSTTKVTFLVNCIKFHHKICLYVDNIVILTWIYRLYKTSEKMWFVHLISACFVPCTHNTFGCARSGCMS